MCGIAGIVNLNGQPVGEDALVRMRDAMEHRGPDDSGTWIDGAVGLAHRRLSILDLSSLGHQPMLSPDGRMAIVLNGEIFNFVELRRELEQRGHVFRSESDTEVLLRLWQVEGASCLDKLIGMYGFAIWDRDRHRLVAARDRAGIKPFYYMSDGSTFLFGSEMKALLAHPDARARLDARGLSDILFNGYALEQRTLLDGVHSLPPGHLLVVEDGRIDVRPYWSVEYRYDHARTFEDTVAELETLLDDAVRMHCRSDAPIGAHLSGGLDSSTVAALSAVHRPGLRTFSIRFDDGPAYDESAYARAVARRIGSTHEELTPKPLALERLLPFLIHHVEYPATDTAIAYFNATRLARRHVTVALTGHGGDEVFGGYAAQFEVGLGRAGDEPHGGMGRGPEPAWKRLAFLLRTEGVLGLPRRLLNRLSSGGGRTPEDDWIARHATGIIAHDSPALTRSFRKQVAGYSPVEAYIGAFRNAPTDELFDRCLHHDLRTYLPSLLHVEDRTSMALSLESRVPLLDHRLIEFAATVPPRTKVPDNRSKQLIRAVMRNRLPDEVLNRRNKGAFPVPVAEWTAGPFAAFARSVLLSERTLDRGVYRPAWIRACVDSGRNVFGLLSFEIWCRLFLDRDRELLDDVRAFGHELRQEVGLRSVPAARLQHA